MDEEIGKWLLDISKYIITAYILLKKVKIKKIRKENNMDTGLLIMYIFVAIIIVGSLVYSRLEDKKGK